MNNESETALAITLLHQVGRGDSTALAQLYTMYASSLYPLALRLLQNREEAEEVLQDTFIQIWKKAGMFDPDRARPFTWFVTILRNKCLDLLRSSSRKKWREQRDDRISMNLEKFSRQPTLPEAELGEEIGYLLSKLPEKQRRCLYLTYYEGHTQIAIADYLNMPIGTVKTHLYRGLQRLRQLIHFHHD